MTETTQETIKIARNWLEIFVPEGPIYIANSRYWRPLDLPEE